MILVVLTRSGQPAIWSGQLNIPLAHAKRDGCSCIFVPGINKDALLCYSPGIRQDVISSWHNDAVG